MWLRSKAPDARGGAASVAAVTFSAGPHAGSALYVFAREEFLRLKRDYAAFRRSGTPEGGTYRGRELRPYRGGRPDSLPEAGLTLIFKEISSIG